MHHTEGVNQDMFLVNIIYHLSANLSAAVLAKMQRGVNQARPSWARLGHRSQSWALQLTQRKAKQGRRQHAQ